MGAAINSFNSPQIDLPNVGLRTALIVDDVAAVRIPINRTVRDQGLSTTLATDGQAAQGILLQQPIDLVITDIEMPKRSGLSLLRWIRRSSPRRLRQVPVIVISSLVENHVKHEVQSNPCSFYLAKPLVVRELQILLQLIATSRWIRRNPLN